MPSAFQSRSHRLAVSWFRIKEVADQIFAIEEPGHVQSYLVNGDRRSALIDTGLGLAPLHPVVDELAQPEIVVLNTHWHFDHVMGNPAFETIAIAGEERRLIQRAIDNATLRRIYIDACLVSGPPLPPGFDPQCCRFPGSVAARPLADGDTIDLLTPVPGSAGIDLAARLWPERTRSVQ